MKELDITIDERDLEKYEEYYFAQHPRAKKKPISHPYHESINVWMIMKRPAMNGLKQKWKDFIIWLINSKGYANLHIKECEMTFSTYYPNERRHDPDNSVPKFILDGMVESGFIEDDDGKHLRRLTLKCFTDTEHPRTEINITIL